MAIDPPAGKAPAPGKDGKAVDTKNQDAKVVDTVVSAPRKCCKCCCGCCDNNFSWCTMCICANKGEYTDGLAQCKTPTDCFCLVIYLVVMAFAVYGMFYGLTYGDVRNIGQPYDRDGNPCGKGTLAKYPFLFFNHWVTNPDSVTGTVCVSECPGVEAQPVECKTNTQFATCAAISSYPSVPFLNRFCLANKNISALRKLAGLPGSVLTDGAGNIADVQMNAVKINLQINKAITIEEIDGWFRDLRDCWVYILICIGFACLIGVLYNCCLRMSPKITIYVSFGLFFVGSGLAGWGCLNQYNAIEDGTDTNSYEGSTIWLVMCLVIWSLGVLFLILFVFNCSRIPEIVSLVEAEDKFVSANNDLIVVTFLTLLALTGWILWWVYVTPLTHSTGTVNFTAGKACGTYSWTTEVTFFFFLNWTSLIWNAYLITVGSCFVYTYAACSYAFSHGDFNNQQRFALDGLKYGTINYIGTIVGSCTMIGLLWVPQVLLTILVNVVTVDSTSTNPCVACCRKCMNTVTDCIKSFINFVSKLIYCDVVLRNSSIGQAGCGVMEVTGGIDTDKEISNTIKENIAKDQNYNGGRFNVDTNGKLLLLGYNARHNRLNLGTESVTTIIVLFGSFFTGWAMRYMITMTASTHNVVVETYIPMLFGLWIGLLYVKVFTYPYDVSGDSILYCYNVTRGLAIKEQIAGKLTPYGKGYSLLNELPTI